MENVNKNMHKCNSKVVKSTVLPNVASIASVYLLSHLKLNSC